jgi:sugar transferase (PEP-CTERM system associated)
MLRLLKQYYPIRNVFFILTESLIILASVLFSAWVKGAGEGGVLSGDVLLKAFLIASICQIALYYFDLYDFSNPRDFSNLSLRLLQAIGVATIILSLVYFIFPFIVIKTNIYVPSISLSIVFIISLRILYTRMLDRGMFNQKIILLGSSDLAKDIVEKISDKIDCGYTLSCIVAESPEEEEKMRRDEVIVFARGGQEGLFDFARQHGIEKIVVALKEKRGGFPMEELLDCRIGGIDVLDGTTFYEMLTGKLLVEQVQPGWLIFSEGFKKSHFGLALKRVMDVFFSFILLVITLPIILIASLLIKLDSKGDIIYAQERVGKRKKIFDIYKFRSMVENAEELSGPVWAGEDDPRITRVGKRLRQLRIDELPQLWNVLKGDMSFVGPRPERDNFVRELEQLIPYYHKRHTIKPGLTGWAQVNYGYGATIEDATEKLNYDLFYIKNVSFLLDLVIVFRTIKIVLFGRGAR